MLCWQKIFTESSRFGFLIITSGEVWLTLELKTQPEKQNEYRCRGHTVYMSEQINQKYLYLPFNQTTVNAVMQPACMFAMDRGAPSQSFNIALSRMWRMWNRSPICFRKPTPERKEVDSILLCSYLDQDTTANMAQNNNITEIISYTIFAYTNFDITFMPSTACVLHSCYSIHYKKSSLQTNNSNKKDLRPHCYFSDSF